MATKKIPPFIQADDWFTISPSDSVNFVDDATNNPQSYSVASIYVGDATAVNIAVVSPKGTVKTFSNVQPGQFLPILAKRINATNTTATNLLGLVGIPMA